MVSPDSLGSSCAGGDGEPGTSSARSAEESSGCWLLEDIVDVLYLYFYLEVKTMNRSEDTFVAGVVGRPQI